MREISENRKEYVTIAVSHTNKSKKKQNQFLLFGTIIRYLNLKKYQTK